MTYMFGLAYHARSLGIQDHLKLSGQNKKTPQLRRGRDWRYMIQGSVGC
jgi:hypothetical protein